MNSFDSEFKFMIYGQNRYLDPKEFLEISNEKDKIEYLIKLACLAPSSHNIQPWIFRIKDKTIKITLNSNRKLISSDKSGRQVYLSLGAAIENLIVASRAYGLNFDYRMFKESEPFTVVTYDSLKVGGFIDFDTLKALVGRHSSRFEFENKKVPKEFYDKMLSIAGNEVRVSIIDEPDKLAKARGIVEESVENAFLDKDFTRELSNWVKPSLKRNKDGMLGYYIGVPWLMSFIVPKLIRNFNLSKSQRKMHSQWLKHAPAFVILATKEDDPYNWIKAGMVFEEIAIEASRRDLKIGVFGAPIEIKDFYKQLQEFTGTDVRPHVFLRIGYTDKIPKFSPRLDIDQVVIYEN